MHLAEQLGLEPGPTLKALQTQILEHDAALDPPRAASEQPSGASEQPPGASHADCRPRPRTGRSHHSSTRRQYAAGDADRRRRDRQDAARNRGGRPSCSTISPAVCSWSAWREFEILNSILPMIAETVGIAGDTDEPLESVLAQRLGSRQTLLLLDNFEQLVAGASIAGRLVGAADQLRVLVTSQVPLRIGAETVFVVGPLKSEAAGTPFIERARVRDREFEPAGEEESAIAAICERVDGMPLAIELAAARTGLLGVRELERRLESPLGLLTRGDRDVPERHQSLRAAIEWTYMLLDTGEVCRSPSWAVLGTGTAWDGGHDRGVGRRV